MKLNKKVMAMALAGTLTIGGVAVSASQKVETVQRRYENIQVKVNGGKEVPVNEPFFIGGNVYVGLRDAGNLVGANIDWDNATKTVLIKTDETGSANPAELAALKSELGNKNLQLATANSKITQLEEKLAQYEDKDSDKDSDKEDDKEPSSGELDADDLEDFLAEEFEDEYKVDWSFDIKEKKNNLELKIKFDSDKDKKDFDKISKSSLEKFAKKVCETLQKQVEDEYDIEDIEIIGEIYDTEEKETIATFDLDDRGRFDYTYERKASIASSDLSDYGIQLYNRYKQFPEVEIPGYDSTSIGVKDIELKEEDGEIIFEIYTNLSSFGRNYWDRMSVSGASELEQYMDDIQNDIEKKFDIEANGIVYDENKDEMATYDGFFELH